MNQEVIELLNLVKELEKGTKRIKRKNEFLEGTSVFCHEASEINKNERVKSIALKTKDGVVKGEFFSCKMFDVNRHGLYRYLKNRDGKWKYQPLTDLILKIVVENECNDVCGHKRIHKELKRKNGFTISGI